MDNGTMRFGQRGTGCIGSVLPDSHDLNGVSHGKMAKIFFGGFWGTKAANAKVSRAMQQIRTKKQEADILNKISSWCTVYLAIGHGGTKRNNQ